MFDILIIEPVRECAWLARKAVKKQLRRHDMSLFPIIG
jgi:hypothetical protein